MLDAPPTGRIAQFLGRQQRARGAGAGGSDQAARPTRSPRLLRSPQTAVPPGDRARGDAGAGDRRRRRRAARGAACRSAGSSSTWSGRRDLDDRDLARLGAGRKVAARTACRAELERGRARRHRRRLVARPARRGPRPRRAAARSRTASGRWSRRSRCRPTSCPRCPAASTSARSTSWPACLRDQGHGCCMAQRHRRAPGSARWPSPARRRARRRRPARRPGTGIIVCCGSGGVGKTTTAAALGAARRRARPQGRGAHHRPGTPAGAVDGHRGARQHPAAGAGRRPRPGGRRLARRDDARHEAHLRRGGREPGQPREGRSRSWPTRSTSRAVQLVRGHPGVHGDGEARPAATREARRRGTLGPDRRRHPAVALGAGLPRRPANGSRSFLDGRFIRLLLAPAPAGRPG